MMDEEKQQQETQSTMSDASGVSETMNSAESSNEQPIDTTAEAVTPEVVAPEQGAESNDAAAATEALTKEIESLKAQLEERNSQVMRIAADFDNFRKRTQKEKEDLELQVKCSTVIELLPVVDNFERARSQIKPQGDEAMNIHKSYQGVYKDFVDRLKRIGVAPMRAEGKEFDPNLHEAVMRQATEEFPEGTVMEELVRGYLLGERVLRHAMVKVAAVPDPSSEESSSESSESEG
jgi:molecular chaperone GrpE